VVFAFHSAFVHVAVQVRLISMNRFLVSDLTAHLSKDWPAALVSVSYDGRGFLVAAFDIFRASEEGDILSYMNKFASSCRA
jgi:hypothetical protein